MDISTITKDEVLSLTQDQIIDLCLPSVQIIVKLFSKGRDFHPDLINESMMHIIRQIHKYDAKGKFDAWIKTVTANVCRNYLRKVNSWEHRVDGSMDFEKFGAPPIEDGLIEKIELEALQDEIIKHINILPKKQKEALFYYIFMDMSFEEVAFAMNCPYNTAKANYRHALMKLRDAMIQTP